MANDLNWFQSMIKSATGAGPNEGYFPDNQGWIPDKWTGGVPTKEAIGGEGYASGKEGYIPDNLTMGMPTKEAIGKAAKASYDLAVPGITAAGGYLMDKGKDAYNYMTSPSSITNFDMNDPESVKALQKRLGVTPDGMFGPKTEEAYRLAVDEERKAGGMDSHEYDYNPQVQEAKFSPFGGLLRKAYSGMDKKMFGGKLPGGYSDKNVMTAEEFYNK